MRFADHLAGASPEVVAQVEALGAEQLVAALEELVDGKEEFVVGWFDARYDDLEAEEIIGWSIIDLARTSETVAHLALDVELATYAVDESDEDQHGDTTIIEVYARVVLGSTVVADRLDLGFGDLRSWISHDALQEP